jgi:protein phosphatase PTC2/3
MNLQNMQFYVGNKILFQKILNKKITHSQHQKIIKKYNIIHKNYSQLNNHVLKQFKDLRYYINSQKGDYRNSNEDKEIYKFETISLFGFPHHFLITGIADGHGGKECSSFISSNFVSYFIKNFLKIKIISDTLRQTVQDLNNNFLKSCETNAGSCLNINIIYFDLFLQKWLLTNLNIGDSRTFIYQNNYLSCLSKDHKPHLDKQHIEKNGGFVERNRLNGHLGVSRAFGNHHLQKKGITVHPDITSRIVSPSDSFSIITACDGIWDVINDNRLKLIVNDIIPKHKNKNWAKSLNLEALRLNTRDNVSSLIIQKF